MPDVSMDDLGGIGDRGVNVYLNSSGSNALHYAIQLGREEIVEILIERGVPVDIPDSEGNLPITIADQLANDKIVQQLIQANAEEPLIWKMPRISDQAHFLVFDSVGEPLANWLRECLIYNNIHQHILVREQHLALRAAPLACYEDAFLIAIEDTARKGRREQFALVKPMQEFSLLNWKNEPIYAANERWGIKLDNDADAEFYCRFFFYFVRGEKGRFNFIESAQQVDELSWEEHASNEDIAVVKKRLQPLRIINRSDNGLITLAGTVVFANALFSTNIYLATTPIRIENTDEEEQEKYEDLVPGGLKLFGEKLLLEDLPIKIDNPPGPRLSHKKPPKNEV